MGFRVGSKMAFLLKKISKTKFSDMNSKKQMLVFLSLMILIMTLVVSFIGTYMNFGFDNSFVSLWLKAWGIAFISALPVALLLAPVIKKFVAKNVK